MNQIRQLWSYNGSLWQKWHQTKQKCHIILDKGAKIAPAQENEWKVSICRITFRAVHIASDCLLILLLIVFCFFSVFFFAALSFITKLLNAMANQRHFLFLAWKTLEYCAFTHKFSSYDKQPSVEKMKVINVFCSFNNLPFFLIILQLYPVMFFF